MTTTPAALRALMLGAVLALAPFPSLAGEPPEPTPATEEEGAETASNGDSFPAASRLVMVRDAETGELRAPTAEEAAAMELGLDPLSHSDAGLTPIFRDHGGVSVVLDGRFQSTSVLQRDADGQDRHVCSSGPADTVRALEADTEEEVDHDLR